MIMGFVGFFQYVIYKKLLQKNDSCQLFSMSTGVGQEEIGLVYSQADLG